MNEINAVAKNKKLSLSAKGLYIFLLSLPDHKFTKGYVNLCKVTHSGHIQIKKDINALQKLNLLKVNVQKISQSGGLTRNVYIALLTGSNK